MKRFLLIILMVLIELPLLSAERKFTFTWLTWEHGLIDSYIYLHVGFKEHFSKAKYELMEIIFRHPQKAFRGAKRIYLTTKDPDTIWVSSRNLVRILKMFGLSLEQISEINHNHSELPIPSDADLGWQEDLYLKYGYKGKVAIYFYGKYFEFNTIWIKSWEKIK